MSNCKICKRKLDVPGDDMSLDCGGDCAQCMSDAGDPDCMATEIRVLKERLAAATETWLDPVTKITWHPPTAWAYAQTCRISEERRLNMKLLYADMTDAEARLQDVHDREDGWCAHDISHEAQCKCSIA